MLALTNGQELPRKSGAMSARAILPAASSQPCSPRRAVLALLVALGIARQRPAAIGLGEAGGSATLQGGTGRRRRRARARAKGRPSVLPGGGVAARPAGTAPSAPRRDLAAWHQADPLRRRPGRRAARRAAAAPVTRRRRPRRPPTPPPRAGPPPAQRPRDAPGPAIKVRAPRDTPQPAAVKKDRVSSAPDAGRRARRPAARPGARRPRARAALGADAHARTVRRWRPHARPAALRHAVGRRYPPRPPTRARYDTAWHWPHRSTPRRPTTRRPSPRWSASSSTSRSSRRPSTTTTRTSSRSRSSSR